ncbi:F5/8 type C domain-containing protein [Streptomyces sp. SLBN-118]|nr:F5/8 type C domain-containing protein [Streptomyces sp. SLBN-118]
MNQQLFGFGRGWCEFVTEGKQQYIKRDSKVVDPLFNCTSQPQTNQYAQAHAVANGFSYTFTWGASLDLGVVKASVQHSLGFSVTETETTTITKGLTVAPGHVGWLEARIPMVELKGHFVLHLRDSFDVSDNFPDLKNNGNQKNTGYDQDWVIPLEGTVNVDVLDKPQLDDGKVNAVVQGRTMNFDERLSRCDESGFVDVAQGKKGSASSNPEAAPQALDDNLQSWWWSAGNANTHADGEWISVDLGSPRKVQFARIWWGDNQCYNYEIQAKVNGEWKTTKEVFDGWSNPHILELDEQTAASKWRVYCTRTWNPERTDGYWNFSIKDLELYPAIDG